jgi:hypothetical protein
MKYSEATLDEKTSVLQGGWVGRLEGDVDYVEFLRSKGVNVAGGNTMAAVDVSAADDEEDVAEGVPVQEHSTLVNHIEQSTSIDSKEQQQAASNSKQQEQSTDKPRASNEQSTDKPRASQNQSRRYLPP